MGRYGHSNDETASIILNKALDIGANMIDIADAYEKGYNKTLIAKSIGKRRSEAFIASKFGIVYEDKYNGTISKDSMHGALQKIASQPQSQ